MSENFQDLKTSKKVGIWTVKSPYSVYLKYPLEKNFTVKNRQKNRTPFMDDTLVKLNIIFPTF